MLTQAMAGRRRQHHGMDADDRPAIHPDALELPATVSIDLTDYLREIGLI
ncbi:MAG TPA: hypothetical protein VEX88_11070 [Glaciibacter sp.]|nr:hypothetical protein [Glaciibacter sp.]